MFNEEEIDKWFQEKFYKDYSKHRPDHIDTPGYNPNIRMPDHPMCRCIINPTYKTRLEISALFVVHMLIQEYKEECGGSLIWIN